MNNYEKIRGMSLEELACWLEENGGDDFHKMTDSYTCQVCEIRVNERCSLEKNMNCPYLNTYGVKQWLESEVEES